MSRKKNLSLKVILLFFIIFSFNTAYAVDSFEGCTIEGYVLDDSGEKIKEAEIEIFLGGKPYTKTISGNETFPGYYSVFSGGCDQGNTSIEIFAYNSGNYGKISTIAENRGVTWINVTLDKEIKTNDPEKESGDKEGFRGIDFIDVKNDTKEENKKGEIKSKESAEKTNNVEDKKEKKYKWWKILLLSGVAIVSLLFVLKKKKKFKLKKFFEKKEV